MPEWTEFQDPTAPRAALGGIRSCIGTVHPEALDSPDPRPLGGPAEEAAQASEKLFLFPLARPVDARSIMGVEDRLNARKISVFISEWHGLCYCTARSQTSEPANFKTDGAAMFYNLLAGMFSNDLAVDLGTANTLVYVRGEGHRAQRAFGRRHPPGRSLGPGGRRQRPRRCWAARPATSSRSGR